MTDFGFTGPDVDKEEFVGYSSGPWAISMGLDVRNKTVDTNIRYHAGTEDVHVPLGQLVQAAGLGGVRRAQTSAQTRTGMTASLTKQAEALHDVAPLLRGTAGYDLMMKAIG